MPSLVSHFAMFICYHCEYPWEKGNGGPTDLGMGGLAGRVGGRENCGQDILHEGRINKKEKKI